MVPSIERATKFVGSDDLERIIIESLKGKVLSVSQGKECPETELGWIAFAQHHGGLTRLLDFTTDPYIAYFLLLVLTKKPIFCLKNVLFWVLNKEWCKNETFERLAKASRFQTLRINDMDKPQFFDNAFVFNPEFVLCVCPFVSD